MFLELESTNGIEGLISVPPTNNYSSTVLFRWGNFVQFATLRGDPGAHSVIPT